MSTAQGARTHGEQRTILGTLQRSALVRLLMLAVMVLLLQVPIAMIDRTIGSRRELRQEAVTEVTSKWGGAQTVRGPMLVVPVDRTVMRTDASGRQVPLAEQVYARFLPEQLDVRGRLEGQQRHRGIFRVPVYRSQMKLSGWFAAPDLSAWRLADGAVHWERAYIALHVSDARAINNAATLSFDGRELPFRPSAGEGEAGEGGIHVPLAGKPQGDRLTFSVGLELNGSVSLAFAPAARRTRVWLGSNWGDPSFQGRWLPRARKVSDAGFEAQWDVPALGRDYPQSWLAADDHERALRRAAFGVALLAPVDHYRMSERSIKYEVLFLTLTFLTLWLFEVLAHLRIHPIQYLLVGSAQCAFFLLELALAEHLGFGLAYVIASCAVVLMVGSYCGAVLERRGRALAVAGVVAGVYGYLYTVLMSENYALLSGSIALFVALAAVMFLTRRIDWYRLGFGEPPATPDGALDDPLDDNLDRAFADLARQQRAAGETATRDEPGPDHR